MVLVLVLEETASSTRTANAEYEYEYEKARVNIDWGSERLEQCNIKLAPQAHKSVRCEFGIGGPWIGVRWMAPTSDQKTSRRLS